MRTILVPLDGSPFGEHALPVAIALARRGSLQLALVHVHQVIVPAPGPAGAALYDPAIDALVREEEAAYLADVSHRIAAVWDGPVTMTLLEAPISDALCRYAEELDTALIVLSTHGRGGIARAWLGSVADRLLRQAPVPTLIVHPGDGAPDLSREPPLGHILIPLDGSSLAEQAIELGTWLGQLTHARYTLLRVVEPVVRGFFVNGVEPSVDVEAQEVAWQQATAYLEGVAARLRDQGLAVVPEVRVGRPANEILECATTCGAHLIAMTTHGRGGVARLLIGSVADKVLRGSTVSLLAYRPEEART